MRTLPTSAAPYPGRLEARLNRPAWWWSPELWWRLVRETARGFASHRSSTAAASLAYYTVLSLAPSLALVVWAAGATFGGTVAQAQLETQLTSLMGAGPAQSVVEGVGRASAWTPGLWPRLLGVALVLVGTTGVFAELQTALNTIWSAPHSQAVGALAFLRRRAVSFAMVLGIGVVLLASVALSAVLAAAGAWLDASGGPLGGIPWEAVNFWGGFGVTALLFALTFKVLPDASVAWRDVWLGALVTAALFSLGKLGIGVYLARSSVVAMSGAASSVVASLVWVHASSMLVLVGAEFTRVQAGLRLDRMPAGP